MGRLTDQAYSDEVSREIQAPADRLYELVTDIVRMGRLSPECRGGRWLSRPPGPRVGARFVGFNRRGAAVWATTSRVVVADPGREFCFETAQSGARWRYRFTPNDDGGSTLVTESREPFRSRPTLARLFAGGLLGGVVGHDEEMRAGMVATLDRLAALAESS